MKECKVCHSEKNECDFYINDKTCKECRKEKVRANRLKNIEYYREYDRKRGSRQSKQYLKQYRLSNPKKYAAHNAVNNAIRDGLITSGPCEICGETKNVHGHHDDYDKPLSVRWLCPAHHKEWHIKNGEGLNAW